MVTMKDLLECGVHFGHQTRKWNPKMKKFIFCSRKNIHIIDLQKTLRYFRYVYSIVREASAEGKSIMFVGTKKQASETIREYASSVGMPYVDYRWLGGMLTNFGTIKKSIRRLELIEEMETSGQIELLTKKEKLSLLRKKEKLERYLGGVRNMKKLPDMIVIIDIVREHIAVEEARRLGIKVIAPLDTNCDPDKVDYPIPGNDDAIRSIQLFCKEITEAIIEGRETNKDEVISVDSGEDSDKNDENFEEMMEKMDAESDESNESSEVR